jgi:hypothetical protein
VAELAVALASDDSAEAEDTRGVLTWDLRNVFSALARNPDSRSLFSETYPLQPTRLAAETGTFSFDVAASTTRYFSVAGGPESPAMALSFSTPAGTRLSETSEPQITIVRIR